MVEKVSQATVSYDDQVWVGRTVAEVTTWTQVFGIEEVAMPEQVPDDVDATHQQSPGRTKESMPGLVASVDYSQDKQLWPTDPGDLLLDELAQLSAAGTPEDVMIEFVVGNLRRTYRGQVTQYTPTGTVGEKRMCNFGAKIFERQETNPRVIE